MMFLELAYENESRMSPIEPEYNFYTFKENVKQCNVGGIDCELSTNSIVLFKCCITGCVTNSFSTTVLSDFVKHIELYHNCVVWNRKCNECNLKMEKILEEYFVKDALEHIISQHLILKANNQSERCMLS